MQTQSTAHAEKSPVVPAPMGGTGSYTLSLNYGLSMSISNGDFLVSLTMSPQIVGDKDWLGLFASQSDLNKCISDINSGGNGSDYQADEWVSNLVKSGGSGFNTWDTGERANTGALVAWFTKDFASDKYVFVFATSAY